MKTSVQAWEYLAEFFLEWEIFQTVSVEDFKMHLLDAIIF